MKRFNFKFENRDIEIENFDILIIEIEIFERFFEIKIDLDFDNISIIEIKIFKGFFEIEINLDFD